MKKVLFLAVIVLTLVVVNPVFANEGVDFEDLPENITVSAVYFLDGDIVFVQKDVGTVQSCSAPTKYRMTECGNTMILSQLPQNGGKVVRIHFKR